jgi:hypothetical protein
VDLLGLHAAEDAVARADETRPLERDTEGVRRDALRPGEVLAGPVGGDRAERLVEELRRSPEARLAATALRGPRSRPTAARADGCRSLQRAFSRSRHRPCRAQNALTARSAVASTAR